MISGELHEFGINIPGDFGFQYNLPLFIGTLETQHTDDFVKMAVGYDADKWKEHNIFEIDHPYIKDLKDEIQQTYFEMCKKYNVQPEKELWINGWVNNMLPNHSLRKHYHGTNTYSYLSGVCLLTDNDHTSTDFFPPMLWEMEQYGTVKINNFKNQISIFPQWIYHEVDTVKTQRISIGFDLNHSEGMKQLMNEDTPSKRSVRLY